jgi:hypothetical protein
VWRQVKLAELFVSEHFSLWQARRARALSSADVNRRPTDAGWRMGSPSNK